MERTTTTTTTATNNDSSSYGDAAVSSSFLTTTVPQQGDDDPSSDTNKPCAATTTTEKQNHRPFFSSSISSTATAKKHVRSSSSFPSSSATAARTKSLSRRRSFGSEGEGQTTKNQPTRIRSTWQLRQGKNRRAHALANDNGTTNSTTTTSSSCPRKSCTSSSMEQGEDQWPDVGHHDPSVLSSTYSSLTASTLHSSSFREVSRSGSHHYHHHFRGVDTLPENQEYKDTDCAVFDFPKFDKKELLTGKYLGRGGFSDVEEIIQIQPHAHVAEQIRESSASFSSLHTTLRRSCVRSATESRYFVQEQCTTDLGESRFAL
eukprot:scaffold1511_cov170-Amphora_coffeaeformis.AAC.14